MRIQKKITSQNYITHVKPWWVIPPEQIPTWRIRFKNTYLPNTAQRLQIQINKKTLLYTEEGDGVVIAFIFDLTTTSVGVT